jgi:hypothetical protein
MAGFAGVKITVSPQLRRLLDGRALWDVLERQAPRAMRSLLPELKARAPRGKTGKLARSFEVRARRKSGLAGGIEVALGSRVPYAHLVEFGHRIIARGRTRFTAGFRGPRGLRGRERTALKIRRAAGSGRRVPGRFFATQTIQAGTPRVIGLLERLMAQDLGR